MERCFILLRCETSYAYLMMMMMKLGGMARIVVGAQLEYVSKRGNEEEQQF